MDRGMGHGGGAGPGLDEARGSFEAAAKLAAGSPPCVELGVRIDARPDGGILATLPAAPALAGRDGCLHGGALALLIDTCASVVAAMQLGGNATLDLRIDHLDPVPSDARISATSRLVGCRDFQATVATEIRLPGRRQPAAVATGTFVRLRRPAAAGSAAEAAPGASSEPMPVTAGAGGMDPFSRWLAIGSKRGRGKTRYRLPFSSRVVSHWQLMQAHGGVIAGYLEAVSLQFLWSKLGVAARTIDITTSYLDLSGASPLHAEATLVRAGRRVAVVRVDAWQADRKSPTALSFGHFQLAPGVQT